jgi:hypothetical protein
VFIEWQIKSEMKTNVQNAQTERSECKQVQANDEVNRLRERERESARGGGSSLMIVRLTKQKDNRDEVKI